MVTLLNQKMTPVESVYSKGDGSFEFSKLPMDQVVLARIEEDDAELVVDLFLFNEQGKVEKRAVKMGSRLYSFEAVKNGFDQLRLLSESDWKLGVAKGKTGLTGRIVDSETFLFGQSNVEVGLYTKERAKLRSTRTDVNGNFSFKDIEKGEYSVKLEGDQAENYSEIVMVDDLDVPYSYSTSDEVADDGFYEFEKLPTEIVEMRRMEVKDAQLSVASDFSSMSDGQPIVLESILFESGSSTLLPQSFAELDRLAVELKNRPTVRIEISGHTDDQGSETTNKLLSQGRAESVKNYLVGKGIEAVRMEHKGYGESKPVASNKTEEGRKQNRRVEFVKIP